MGSPISSISVMCLAKKFSGGVSLITSAFSTSFKWGAKSNRLNFIVAARLFLKRKVLSISISCYTKYLGTSQVCCPTNKEQQSKWFHSLLQVVVSIDLFLWFLPRICCCMMCLWDNDVSPVIIKIKVIWLWYFRIVGRSSSVSTWYSNARLSDGMKTSSSRKYPVSGLTIPVSFLAFVITSTP